MRIARFIAITWCSFSGTQALASGPAVATPYALSESASSGACGAVAQCIYQINAAHNRTLLDIRRDVLKQQKNDGGTLTPVHLAEAQRRLDSANRIYRHRLAGWDRVASTR